VLPKLFDIQKSKNRQLYKFVYIKTYSLSAMREGAPPVTHKFVKRLNREVAVFDEFHMFKLSIFKTERKKHRVGDRSSGVVDMQILHPWQNVAFSDAGAAQKEDVIDQVIKKPSAVFFTRSMYYNGFQPGNEQFAIKMEQDTDEARIVMDFTSIQNIRKIIKGSPKGIIRKGDVEEEAMAGETSEQGIYQIGASKLDEGDVLRVDFTIDWSQVPGAVNAVV